MAGEVTAADVQTGSAATRPGKAPAPPGAGNLRKLYKGLPGGSFQEKFDAVRKELKGDKEARGRARPQVSELDHVGFPPPGGNPGVMGPSPRPANGLVVTEAPAKGSDYAGGVEGILTRFRGFLAGIFGE